ncbi:MAG: VCBS repeat-containing protein [Cyclobacteriaceae bacterium]|nr:VCBS repeat-containing protein [Cyclobacteriaceae bacterium]
MNFRFRVAAFYFLALACFGCSNPDKDKPLQTLFTSLPPDSSGINFVNKLSFDRDFNIYTYRNFYNGGGVGLADINNDGLLDVYLTANQEKNKLYLNKGNFKFEDITEKAGVAGTRAWSTGVSLADVNGDGWTDIYVCNSGDVKGDDRENELFINNGDLTFSERAEEYGVADKGFSTHAVFFDYDRDGDLDLYILNNSYQSIGSFNLRKNERGKRDVLGGHKLLRNDKGHFSDVSESAGIFGSVIAFGLGVTVGDINKDGWQDIYVSNDFFERDYLYINNQNGTFKECLPATMKSISAASMGADLADVNNDAFPDLFVTEMLPNENSRIKTVTTFDNWNRYQYGVTNDYFHQFTRNMLQVSNQGQSFSEIGRFAGVEATDWSWGALMFDADNDGLKDIFVANGIYQDLTNQDFLSYASSEEFVKMIVSGDKVDYRKLIDVMPSNPIPNHFFRNKGNLGFENMSSAWIGKEAGFSNGSAYGDLDNDGDLDFIVNNVNMPSYLYRNNAEKLVPQNHYLKFILKGSGGNLQALGTKITAEHQGKKFYLEQMPMRGFESTVDFRPNLGLGSLTSVDKITIEWPDGTITQLDSVKTNQTLTLESSAGKPFVSGKGVEGNGLFKEVNSNKLGVDFKQTENEFVDFDRDRLIYHMVSTEGPKISVADINKDGLDDLFIGAPKEQSSVLYTQSAKGTFKKVNEKILEEDKGSEDIESTFFDADGDGDLDLYVCSGGNEFSSGSSALFDRLYFNDGRGVFEKSKQILPVAEFQSKSTVTSTDIDGDGDMDLFVGVRLKLFSYGMPVNGYILINDGKGNFSDQTDKLAPGLKNIGLITDSSWADIDGDKDEDLLIVGEWMNVKVFLNNKGNFSEQKENGLDLSQGWWNCIESADVDHDGDIDFVVGNLGLNSRFRASVEKPVSMFVGDFDQNGTIEQILCAYSGDKSYPVVLRHDLISQIPSLKKKFLKYDSYKDATIDKIFTPEQMAKSIELKANTFATSLLLNDGKGKFTIEALPMEAQLSIVFAILIDDLDKDGNSDILLGGNLYKTKPEVGRYDASYGTFLKGDGKGKFTTVPNHESGLLIDGEVRDIKKIKVGKDDMLVISRNNDTPVFLKIK